MNYVSHWQTTAATDDIRSARRFNPARQALSSDQISVKLELFSPSSVADLLTLYPLLRPKSGFLKNRRAVKSCHEDLVVGNRGCTQGMGAVR